MEQLQGVTILRRPRQGPESGDRICTEPVGKIKAEAVFLFLIIEVTQTLSKKISQVQKTVKRK